jgi:predicted DNA-binding WGR domain protein
MFGYVGKLTIHTYECIVSVGDIMHMLRGRVGYNGQKNLEDFGSDLDDAKRFFCQK